MLFNELILLHVMHEFLEDLYAYDCLKILNGGMTAGLAFTISCNAPPRCGV